MVVLESVLDAIAIGFEIGGLMVLLSSGLIALARWLTVSMPEFWRGTLNLEQKIRSEFGLRLEFGHQIVFALEFFISADIIKSIQAHTFAELAKLGIIVVIRTVLHYSLR